MEPETLRAADAKSSTANFETDSDDDMDEEAEKILLWDWRYDRQTLTIRRRDNHVSPGHFIDHRPKYF